MLSGLNAGAAEWRPSTSTVAAALPDTLDADEPEHAAAAAGDDDDQAEAAAEWQDYYYQDGGGDGYLDEAGQWVAYDEQGAAGDEEEQELSAEHSAALLASAFPGHAPALLKQLLETCSLQQAATILADLEREQRRDRVAASQATAHSTGQQQGSGGSTYRRQQDFALQLEQFPSLADMASSLPAGQQQAPQQAASSWAAKAAAPPQAASGAAPAMQQQQQHPLRQPAAPRGGGSSSSGSRLPEYVAGIPTVQTGAAVAQDYAAARAEARDWARVRNTCFQQATAAFNAGDKATAKELSRQGRAAAELMFEAHQRASSATFSSRNASLAQQAVIDLHGLHVQEVRQLLPQKLADMRQQHGGGSVHIIVGAGKHTNVGPQTSRLGPAVEALLTELGFRYRRAADGLLRVELS